MLGNDVVDLRDPDSDAATLSSRFDRRVFTEAERSEIVQHADSDTHRWRHWAGKEAAYKALRREQPRVVFSPIRFEVDYRGGEAGEGRARYRNQPDGSSEDPTFRLQLLWNEPGALHVVALADSGPATDLVHDFCRVSELDPSVDSETPSRSVRKLACLRLAKRLDVDVKDLEVRKRGRIPELWIREAPAPAVLSLSHHGGWVGFACVMHTEGSAGERLS